MTIRLLPENFRPDEDGSFEGAQIAFHPALPTADPLPLLASVLADVGEDLDGAAGFWGPVPLPDDGALFALQWWDGPDDLSGLLEMVAEGLDASGASGELRPFRGAAPAYESRPRETLHGIAVIVSPRLRDDALDRAVRRGGFALGDTAPESLSAGLERMLRWSLVPDGRHYVQFAAGSFEVAERERGELLRRSVSADEVATLTSERWPHERRGVTLDAQGRIILVAAQGGARMAPERLTAIATEALQTFADVAEYGCALAVSGPVGDATTALLGNWPQLPQRTGLTWTRGLEATRIPDAFAAQLLGPHHHLPPLDPRKWSVQDLGAGVRIVLARDAHLWAAEGGPEPQVLAGARAEFGPLLTTAEQAAGEQQRIKAGDHPREVAPGNG